MVKEKHQSTSVVNPVDYLVANLLDFYRDPRKESRFFEAAKMAINQISRMSKSNSAIALEKRFFFFASKLKNNITAASLRDFAEKCLESAYNSGVLFVTKDKNPSEPPKNRSLHKRAKETVIESLKQGFSEASAVQRAANKLVKNQKQNLKEARLAQLAKSHPLEETLTVLAGHRALAKEDVRHQLLRLKKHSSINGEGVLFNLLKKAESFSNARLHKLLGDELFFLCRPLGFLDQKASTLMVEVPTSAHLYALTYRKLEILNALKKDAAFLATKKIIFKVTNTGY